MYLYVEANIMAVRDIASNDTYMAHPVTSANISAYRRKDIRSLHTRISLPTHSEGLVKAGNT